jgi:hypothetical protein
VSEPATPDQALREAGFTRITTLGPQVEYLTPDGRRVTHEAALAEIAVKAEEQAA